MDQHGAHQFHKDWDCVLGRAARAGNGGWAGRGKDGAEVCLQVQLPFGAGRNGHFFVVGSYHDNRATQEIS
jgi:hypothetical protein